MDDVHAAAGTPSGPGLASDRLDLLFFTLVATLTLVEASGTWLWADGAAPGLPFRPLETLLVGTVFGLQGLYLLFNLPVLAARVGHHAPLVALVLLCLASTAWSVDPSTSLRAALGLGATTGMVLAAIERHGGGVVGRRIAAVLTVIVGVNLLAVVSPERAFMTGEHDGAFRGLTSHKNTLGPLIALHLGLVLALLGDRGIPRSVRWLWVAMVPFDLIGLAMTRSAGAVVIFLLAVLLIISNRAMHRATTVVRVVIWAMVGTTLWLLFARFGPIETLLNVLGRSTTLTGRSEIWDLALRVSSERPLMGWGYKAFPLSEVLAATPLPDGSRRSIVGSAHNSYLDILTGLGWAGVAAWAATMVWLGHTALQRQRGPMRAAGVVVLATYLCSGLAESTAGLNAGPAYIVLLCVALPAARERTARLFTYVVDGFRPDRITR